MKWPSTGLILQSMQLFLIFCHASPDKTSGEFLVKSNFIVGTSGWSIVGNGVKGPLLLHKSICAEDFGPAIWYWSAPVSFFTLMSSAYGGTLVIRRGFFEINRGGRDEVVHADFDIEILSSSMKSPIGITNLVFVGEFYSVHQISLSSESPWAFRDGSLANDDNIRQALGTISAFRIRGGHYHGGEYAYLSEVAVIRPTSHPIPEMLAPEFWKPSSITTLSGQAHSDLDYSLQQSQSITARVDTSPFTTEQSRTDEESIRIRQIVVDAHSVSVSANAAVRKIAGELHIDRSELGFSTSDQHDLISDLHSHPPPPSPPPPSPSPPPPRWPSVLERTDAKSSAGRHAAPAQDEHVASVQVRRSASARCRTPGL